MVRPTTGFLGCPGEGSEFGKDGGPRKMGNPNKKKNNKPYITWVFMGKLSPRIPRLNTINAMGTLLGVHPLSLEWEEADENIQNTWMSRTGWKLGSMVRINELFHLLINGIY